MSALARTPNPRVGPLHELGETPDRRARSQRARLAQNDAASGTVERDPVAVLDHQALDRLGLFVHFTSPRSGDAGLAHSARHHGGVRSCHRAK